jgi:hypothetical protein
MQETIAAEEKKETEKQKKRKKQRSRGSIVPPYILHTHRN